MVAAVGVLMAVIIHKKRERERGGVVIEETVPNQPPNIEVAAASNPRNEGPSLLARARVVNLLRARNQPPNLLRARNQPPNIEVAAASPNSNPRNGASLLARARVLNLLRGRKKRIIEGEVVYLEQFKSLYLSN